VAHVTCRVTPCGKKGHFQGLCAAHREAQRSQRGELCHAAGCGRGRLSSRYCNNHQTEVSRAKKARQDQTWPIVCALCGESAEVTKRTSRFCSNECFLLARMQKFEAERSAASQLVYVGPSAPRSVLPERHPARQPAPRRSDWWDRIVVGTCLRCGEPFTALAISTATLPRYCSSQCARRKPRKNRFRLTRRVRLSIYERDGWVCQLCGGAVDRDGDPTGDWTPSLDHIIPQAQGGEHDPANLRLAHRWCNAVLNDGRKYCEDDLKVA
jgi:hypothetical protein